MDFTKTSVSKTAKCEPGNLVWLAVGLELLSPDGLIEACFLLFVTKKASKAIITKATKAIILYFI